MRKWEMRYQKPARCWTETLPLGNGKIGASVYGGVGSDRISLNLDTLWSGYGAEKANKSGAPDWEMVRKLVFAHKHEEAEQYLWKHVLGEWSECYLPAGNLSMILQGNESAQSYERKLSLNDGIYQNNYITDGIEIKKEMFVSCKRQLLAVRVMACGDKYFDLDLKLDSPLKSGMKETENPAEIFMIGQAPAYVAPDYYQCEEPIRYEEGKGIRFCIAVQAVSEKGTIVKNGDSIQIQGTDEAVIYVSGETDFEAFENGTLHINTDDLWQDKVCAALAEAKQNGYEKLKREHADYFRSYFERVDLCLGDDFGEVLPTDERLFCYQKDKKDQGLAALMFQYGRYLLMTSSAPGSQCANLQGIWNEEMRAPWASNYTVNINTEMNYWMAESCNLSEFHQPLFNLIARTAKQGEKTAEELYGLDGWVSHHNVDLWGHSTPVGALAATSDSCTFGMWNMSSGWLCRHLWEHYRYTLDRDFLEEYAYPLVEGAVKFYLGYLHPWGEYLVTVPSTSPENQFIGEDGKSHSVYIASTMDISILKELFNFYLEMCRILGKDGVSEQAADALKKLPPFRIGANGQLQEWHEDFAEMEITHRHVSHLYGLYPANIIGKEDDEIRKACAEVLKRRSDDGSGWCIAWKACLWARLGNGDRAMDLLNNQMRYTDVQYISAKGGGTYSNLFCAHPPFQIDGNFGYTAAVVEMLLQSQDEELVLLPALPSNWSRGYVRGLKARGGYEVDITWEESRVTSFKVRAQKSSAAVVRYNGTEQLLRFIRDGQEIEQIVQVEK